MDAPSYKFRLERVRALRERKEELAQERLAGALAVENTRRVELQRTQERLADGRRTQTHASARDLLAHQAYVERIEQVQREHLAALQRQSDVVAQQRRELVSASQELQTLERLKQKGQTAHRLESARREQNVLDEIATARFRRVTA